MPRPDTLTQDIGVLKRREVEARILAPVVDALSAEFGREAVLKIVSETIIDIARKQGQELAEAMGGNDAASFARSLEAWTRGGALEIEVGQQSDAEFDFDVKRCRYAEMYRDLGIPELGAVLSCNRDYALAEGFAPDANLTRTQTILGGAECCDFRYRFPTSDGED